MNVGKHTMIFSTWDTWTFLNPFHEDIPWVFLDDTPKSRSMKQKINDYSLMTPNWHITNYKKMVKTHIHNWPLDKLILSYRLLILFVFQTQIPICLKVEQMVHVLFLTSLWSMDQIEPANVLESYLLLKYNNSYKFLLQMLQSYKCNNTEPFMECT